MRRSANRLAWLLGIGKLVAITLIMVPACWAQITGVNDQTATPTAGIGHDYLHMLNETVNPANGSVSLRIQIPVPKGRGLTLPFAFAYDSGSIWAPGSDTNGIPYFGFNLDPSFYYEVGWSYSLPLAGMTGIYIGGGTQQQKCPAETGFVFQDTSGGRYSLGMLATDTQYRYQGIYPCGSGGGTLAGGTDFYSAELAGFQKTMTVADSDGTTYSFPGTSSCEFSDGGMASTMQTLPSSVEDRNGNLIKFSLPASCTAPFTETDTAGRLVLSSSGFGTTGNTITVGGLSQPYTVTWGTTPANTALGSILRQQSSYCYNNINNFNSSLPVIAAIKLPNGQEYQFSYDSISGLLSKITYPTGGYISYTWAKNTQSEFANLADQNGNSQACPYTYDTYAVSHRYVSFDGSTIALQQDFSYTTTWNPNNSYSAWTAKTTTVTTHDLIQGTTYSTQYTYSPMNAPAVRDIPSEYAVQIPMEQTVVYNDPNGHAMKTVSKSWKDLYELANEQTTLDNGMTSEDAYTYGAGGQVTEKDEYDFGPTLKRKTLTTYQAFGPTPIYPGTGSPLFDRPCKVVVEDGSSNPVAETDSLYDSGSTVCGTAGTPSTSSATTPTGTHDETNYGPTSSTPRGNATKVTHKCLSGCSTDASTTYAYDETGQVTSMTDPCGNASCSDMTGTTHTTTYAYTDSYGSCSGSAPPSGNTNAYLTQVTNALGQITKFCYGYDDGQLRGATDPNSQITIYKYSDSLRRLTETDFPDGGQTLISYNDTPPTPTVTTTRKFNASQSVTSVTIANGMGMPTETELTSDPQGTDYTVTSYNGVGQIRSVTNPYRTVSDPTYGTTTYTDDPLGRTTSVVKPDGSSSTVTTTYSGNCTTVTDEAGKNRESCTDGLGRMTSVIENPGGLGYTTNYTYDTLDDLTGVLQGGSRSRSFNYDSLKRLTSSTNPEPGTVTYAYDLNGNVSTKTDARSITTTHTYDVLNRLTKMTYSNGDSTVANTYDQSACLGQPSCYNIGHRTRIDDAGGAEEFSYDKMGREIAEERWTGTASKTTSYAYDLAGNMTSLTYPSGRTITYTYDSAGRPSEAQDTANNINYALGTCANGISSSGVCYAPNGSVAQVQNGTNLVSTYIYNKRFQPCWMYGTTGTALPTNTTCTAGDPGPGNILDLQYNFNLGAGDNGNVVGITNKRDSTRTQTFTYDQLNRIVTAKTSSTSGSNCWGETYTIDQWANLTAIGALSGYSGCTQENLSVSATTNNQLSSTGFSYDTSGNMLNDGAHAYAYNAESEIKSAAGVNYTYDGDGNRVEKSSGKAYWYGAGTEILDESDLSGNITNEYVFFGGKRIAMRNVSSGTIYYYEDDMLGSARTMVQVGATSLCYDADFYPFGGERIITNTCAQNYKFEGKERDTETGNDDFGARYYTSRLGRWLSADWSSVPAPVPYANLSNPQTLNLYAMVSENPETFADLDGHQQDDDKVDPKVEEIENREFDEKLRSAALAVGQGKADDAAARFANFLSAQPEGVDDPLTGICYAPRSNTPTMRSASEKGSGEPPQLAAGKEAHKNEPVRPGEKAEVRTPSGKRMDRYDADKAHIREIKPDNARGEKAGQKQLQQYKTEMDQATKKSHTTELTKYKRPQQD
ncbi:MAG: RHS repeat-associated core domain-containing protein [Candidatus Acidiferrales bacterium]